METRLCFCYGSNMSTERLRARVASARFVAVARLREHKLRFHKAGNDGSAKCDAEFTGDRDSCVHGVVFAISVVEKRVLDRIEGVGAGYEEKSVKVAAEDGRILSAIMYLATRIDSSLRPFAWYKRHVLAGAREHGLPEDYIARIEAIESKHDPDRGRSERETALYRKW